MLAIFLSLCIVIYMLGPKAPEPQLDTALPEVSTDLRDLEEQIAMAESKVPDIKPHNTSTIVWATDSLKEKTPYSLVYLHGFSASQGEGDPLHRDFARRYGMNLYLPRLAEHGRSGKDLLLGLSPEKLTASAKEAVAIGQQLGDSVILMSCSTGGTLSLYLASEHPEIHSMISYSPNVDIYDGASELLTMPWGLEILELVEGGKYHQFETTGDGHLYWTSKYRIEAIVGLKSLIQHTMTPEVFAKVEQPFFMGYYYKNDSLQDKVVSVPRMLEMYEQLGTPGNRKRKVAFPNAGHHVISSKHTSQDLESVRQETFAFAEEVLGLKPMDSLSASGSF